MSKRTFRRPWAVLSIAMALISGVAALTMADLPAAEPSDLALPLPQLKQVGQSADPLAVPEGTPEQLLKFIESLREARPEKEDEESIQAFRLKLHRAVVEAATRILAGKPTDEQAEAAAHYKAVSLSVLSRLGDETAADQLAALPKSLADAGRAELARQIRGFLLQFRMRDAMMAGPEEIVKVVDEVKAFVAEGSPGGTEVGLAVNATRLLEMIGNTKAAADAYRQFGAVLAKSTEPQIARLGAKFEGAARRLELVGKPMELKGALLDGTQLDWASYRGKVVLVQFWATWCAPCRRELVNVKRNYDRYHARGFEVIGVNCDDERTDLDEYLKENALPWPNLFSADPEHRGMDNPMADYYGVLGIPTLILVGKDGNVVSIEARGQVLDEQLEQLLGPAEPAPSAPKPGEKAS